MTKYWAGIGSRQTPLSLCPFINKISLWLESKDYTLRSGGAIGADTMFEQNILRKEIFRAEDATEAAISLSSKYHPNWGACSEYARKLHGRNAMILLGRNLDIPVKFVVCYTTDGLATGGTGQAIRIATALKIPIYNLYFPHVQKRIQDALNR